MIRFFFFLFTLVCVCANEKRLLNRLLVDYEPLARPVHNASTSVLVKLNLGLIKVINLDLKHEILTANIILVQEWVDEFLRWIPEEYNGLETLEISTDKVWVPDIILVNDLRDWEDLPPRPHVVVKYTGEVRWAPPLQLRTLCRLDVKFYPFDSQRCYFKFESWNYESNKVEVVQNTEKEIFFIGDYIESAFEITNLTTKMQTVETSRGINNVVIYGVELQRRVLYHIYSILIPCIMISMLTVMVFRLSPDSGEKIELGITILLVFHVVLWSVSTDMPENENSIPLIAVYLTSVMFMTSLSVIMSVFVVNVYTRGHVKEVPNWIRWLILDKIRRLLRLKLPNVSSKRKARRFRYRYGIGSLAENLGLHRMTENSFLSTDNDSEEITIEKQMLKTLRSIQGKNDRDTRNENVSQEWRSVAEVLDRMLFYVYLIATILISVFLLILVPGYHHTVHKQAL